MQAEDYLLLFQRYIELNPVRADMVDDPAHYRWSSCRANGLGQADPLLSPHTVYLQLAKDDTARREAYRALFRSELDAEAIGDIRMALNQGQPLGNSRFRGSIERGDGTTMRGAAARTTEKAGLGRNGAAGGFGAG